MMAAFFALSLTVYGRLIALELKDGPDYRSQAEAPIVRRHSTAAVRGSILARDGTPLAYDQPTISLALQYRWLQEPADDRWLRRTARGRLTAAERRDPKHVAAETQAVLAERRELWHKLADLCGMNDDAWHERCAKIQRRVESLVAVANSRRQSRYDATSPHSSAKDSSDADDGLLSVVGQSIVDALFASDDSTNNTDVIIADEVSEHVICDEVPLSAVAEIEGHSQRYPGTKLITTYRRVYPEADLAAHTLGYLGKVNPNELDKYDADDVVGRAGIERQYEKVLQAHRGLVIDRLDGRGSVIESTTLGEASAGSDITLTIDPALERTTQSLVDQAIERRLPVGDDRIDHASGAAILVMDIRTGAILAAASGPRFDPNGFARGENGSINRWLADPARPLFDRTVQMAIPPGSVFKIVSAAALLDAGVDPQSPFECQGYLHQPDALRCAIYRHTGAGHGPVTMDDALARSCNVYFFHYAEQLSVGPLMDWARRFEFGGATGIDLPGESRGGLSAVDRNDAKPPALDPRLFVIGQGPITVTPLQIARMIAAIANGGYLVAPHVAEQIIHHDANGVSASDRAKSIPVAPPKIISGLSEKSLAAIRKGLSEAVADEQGTAHATIELENLAVAGKTGTAQTGAGQPEHAWFAGYAPADRPQVAIVVVIEHAGDSAPATGPVAKRLFERMDELGYFAKTSIAASNGFRAPAVVK
jgi:penicillin-binding protein 2